MRKRLKELERFFLNKKGIGMPQTAAGWLLLAFIVGVIMLGAYYSLSDKGLGGIARVQDMIRNIGLG